MDKKIADIAKKKSNKDFENTKIDNLIFISNEKYLIEVSPTIIDLNDSIQFKGVSYEYIKNKIDILKIWVNAINGGKRW